MTQIISVAGKKQAGKSTAVNFIIMTQLIRNGVCRNARLNKEGKIEVSDLFSNTIPNHPFFLFSNGQIGNYEIKIDSVLEQISVKEYSFAKPLKQLCINILGLTHEQCYGSDKEKNSLTQLQWGHMPGITLDKDCTRCIELIYHDGGNMTAREVLQYVGTNIFRQMLPTCWVDTAIRQIKQDQLELALVSDVRFRNEADALKKEGAFLIKLTRGQDKDDHISENDLKDYIDFDCVIDNRNMSIEEQNQAIYQATKHLIF